jgi:hypothetical protein
MSVTITVRVTDSLGATATASAIATIGPRAIVRASFYAPKAQDPEPWNWWAMYRTGGRLLTLFAPPSSSPVELIFSLKKNVAGQNFTFALINVATDAALTGGTVVGFVSLDGGAQSGISGVVSELGNGVYNYAPTQAETNGNCVSFLMTATSAVPENMMFLTGGLHRNIASQHITFCMFSTAGVADAAATVTVKISKDGGVQGTGSGSVTNLGNGQYDYAPTQAETNGANVSFLFAATGDVPQNISIFTVP